MSGYSLIILHHDKEAYSRACLESVLRSAARPLEVINVDNGSRDATPRLLDEWEARAHGLGITTKRLSYATNIGAVRGRNEALKVASGQYLAFLDNDTVLGSTDWLEQLAAALTERPGCGIVVPALLFPWEPFAIECCGAAVSPGGRIRYLQRGEATAELGEPREVQCAISAAWLMTRQVVEAIGELDEEFSPVQYEDLDYCYRARQKGWSVWTVPGVRLYHFEHTTTAGSDDINFRYVTTKNGILFKKRWSGVFSEEAGSTEEAAAWVTLPKKAIHEVDWRGLLPENHLPGQRIGPGEEAPEGAAP